MRTYRLHPSRRASTVTEGVGEVGSPFSLDRGSVLVHVDNTGLPSLLETPAF